MIPFEQMRFIKLEKKLTHRGAIKLSKAGYSRLPVFKNGLICGILLIKSLIGL